MKSVLFVFAATAVLCAPALASAQTAPSPDVAGDAAANAVSTVVVTANRSLAPISQVGQSVTVITGADIRADQETDVADILARTPGVDLTRNGGPGEQTSIFIRGADSDQTVVLIDGVKVNDPSDVGSGYDFANLLAGDVSRIEVLRGPQSTLYGSEAIGGVVNIVTASATRPLEGDAQVEGGSYGTAYAKGGLGGHDGPVTWRLGAYYNSTDSVSAFDRAFGGKEDDGFHTAGASGRLTYDITPDLQLDERAYYTDSRNEFDGYDTPTFSFGDDAEFGRTQQVVDYTGLNVSLFDGRLKNRIAYEYNELDRRNEDPDEAFTKFTALDLGRAQSLDYEGTFAIADGYTLVFGAQDQRSTFDADAPYYDIAYGDTPAKANSSIASGYGQLTARVLPNLTLTGGVRYDAHSTFGDHVTGQASAAWTVRTGTIVRASFGQGFKAPSLYQLYSEYGTPSLRPEEANGWDAGVEQHLLADTLVVSATYFGRRTTNLIEYVDCFDLILPQCSVQPLGFYTNLDKDQTEGVELQGELKPLPGLDLSANYTYDDDENRSSVDVLHRQLARRPKDTANLAATYVWPVKLSTTVAVRYAGRSFDSDLNDIVLASYTLVDLRASYPLRPGLELYGRIENLADQHYETAYQYGTLGRAAYGGVRLAF